MKINKNFVLRKLGKSYIAVPLGEESKKFSGVIQLNEAGAWIWNHMKDDISKEELIEKMCAAYDDLSAETAETDLDEFLDAIKIALIL